MAVLRVGEPQRLLEPELPRGGVQQVAPPHHLCDPHGGVVHHHRQLIGVHPVGPAEDEVPAVPGQILGEGALDLVHEGDRLLRHLHPPGGAAGAGELLPLLGGETAAPAVVDYHPVRAVGGGGGQALRPGAVAGVDEAPLL